jgi:uncharacterized repeat protein (TIGR03803 family)
MDGGVPTSGLVQGADGDFYGMTGGGAFGYGNVFKLTLAGAFSTLYSFTGGSDGSSPSGVLAQGTDGNFYGATARNTFHGFQFYGTIFKLTPAGALTTVYTLNFYDGFYPSAGLIQGSDGNFYGTTFTDGAGQNGTVFIVSPDGALGNLVALDGFDTGAHPASALVQGADGSLYGTTTAGGVGGRGTIFRLSFTGAPQITSQPHSRAALAGGSAVFSVAVFGAPPLFYQWQKDGTNLTDGGVISGSAARILSLTNILAANAGAYSVIVSNSLGSITSASAQLTLVSPPVFQTISPSNHIVSLTWSTAAGQTHQLQYKASLTSANWTNLGGPLTATGDTLTATDAIAANSQRFYRVILLL